MEGSCMQRKMPVERDKCSGCFACAAICPVRAIGPEEDKETHHFFLRSIIQNALAVADV